MNDLRIRTARPAEVDRIVRLVNAAYRAEGGRRGWTDESHLFEGARIDAPGLRDLLRRPRSTILTAVDGAGAIVGCVHLEAKGDRLYLGLLSVAPELQDRGIGKALVAAGEARARTRGLRAVFMTVISARTELIAWYERHGYRRTGRKEPFPADERLGAPRRTLEFDVLEKRLPRRADGYRIPSRLPAAMARPPDLTTLEDEFLGDEEKPDPSEEYLEALAMLEQMGRRVATVGEVAQKVKVRPPSAVQMLRRLERRGLVDYLAREGVRLTTKGRNIGQRMVRNGRLMELFIAQDLGLPKELGVAHAIEHSLSMKFTDAICSRLGHPDKCPHGYPIPPGRCCKAVRRP